MEKQSVSGVLTESSASASTAEQGKVAFAVFYETLCPDSRGFFINQLLPTVERAPDIFTVTLVPYGKAMVIPQLIIYLFTEIFLFQSNNDILKSLVVVKATGIYRPYYSFTVK